MTEERYYMPKMLKVVSGAGDISIFRIDRKMFYAIDTNKKEYSELTFEEMDSTLKKIADKVKAAREELKKQLKDEDQRKQLEKMLGIGSADPVTIENTEEKKTIAGYSCTKSLMLQGEDEVATVWATTAIKEFESMGKELAESLKRTAGILPQMSALAEGMMKVKGFAMETEFGKDMKTTVTRIEKKTLPASEFDVPSGYKKVKSKLTEALKE